MKTLVDKKSNIFSKKNKSLFLPNIHIFSDTRKKELLYLFSFIVSVCGLVYQLVLGEQNEILHGNGHIQTAITLTTLMSGFCVASFWSESILKHFMKHFLKIEYLLGFLGGTSVLLVTIMEAYTETGQEFSIFLTFVIGILIGLEMPILIRKAEEIKQELNKSTARVLLTDYGGSILGGLFFIFYAAKIGYVKTSFIIGFLNILVALISTNVFKDEIKRPFLYQVTGVILCTLMATGYFFGETFAQSAEQKLYQDPITCSFKTKYQDVKCTKYLDDERVYLDGNLQFSSIDEYRYHEALADIPMGALQPKLGGYNILILGGGDGLLAKQLLDYGKQVNSIKMIDLDAQFVDYARNNLKHLNGGSLSNEKVTVLHKDAFKYLEKDTNFYDLILVDLPDPNNQSLNKLYSTAFYSLIRNHLTPDGITVIQSTSPYFAPEVYWTIDYTVQSIGLKTLNYHVDVPSFGDWGFVMASRNQLDVNDIQLKVKGEFLNQGLIPSLFQFPSDMDKEIEGFEYQANTKNQGIILDLYEKAWRYY